MATQSSLSLIKMKETKVTITDTEATVEVDGLRQVFYIDEAGDRSTGYDFSEELEYAAENILNSAYQQHYDKGWTYLENGDWVSKSGRLAEYPGAPFHGQLSKADHQKHLAEWNG